MAIKDINPEVQPQLVWDDYFLSNLRVKQFTRATSEGYPKYEVGLSYQLMAEDSEGNLYYKDMDHVKIDDYMVEAMDLAAAGNPELLQAIDAIQNAMAVILHVKKGIDTEII